VWRGGEETTCGEVGVSFSAALDGGEWSSSRSGRSPQGNGHQVPVE
jgi:hypothetical protein